MSFPDAKYLKAVMMVLVLIPIVTGPLTLLGIYDPVYQIDADLKHAILDSNLRFFGGVWLVLGVALLVSLKELRQPNPLFQWILFACFCGGVGRLASMVFFTIPPLPFVAFTALEILVLPYLMVWQRNLARSA